jgi:hypothetical protein
MATYPVFVAGFAASVGAAAWFRYHPALPGAVAVASAALGAAQAVLLGTPDPLAVAGSVTVSLAVGARVAMLGTRDWRDPLGASFGVLAAMLLAEVLAVGAGRSAVTLPVVVAQFFLGSLASRAASVALLGPVPPRPRGRGRVLGAGAAGVAALGGALAGAGLLGGPDGGLRRLGSVALTLLGPVLSALAFVVSTLVFRPLALILEALHLDLSLLRRIADTLRSLSIGGPTPAGGGSGVHRLVGLTVLVLAALLLVRAIRVLRLPEWRGVAQVEAPPLEPEVPAAAPSRPRRKRRARSPELPADTVRRWYAEALLALARRGVSRAPSATLAEVLAEAGSRLPECAPALAALTRAYEDVRYGGRRVGRDDLRRLEPHRARLMEVPGGRG